MSSTITTIVSDLNDSIDNRYFLVLEVADMAKRLLDETRAKGQTEYVSGSMGSSETSLEKAIYQALIMKASEIDMGDGLIG